MPPKRLRRYSPSRPGLATGERLKRAKLAGNDYSAWGWVGTVAHAVAEITEEHRLAACGFANNSPHPFCSNKFAAKQATPDVQAERPTKKAEGELEDDVIVISDDDTSSCSSKFCRSNPNCLNYLGQDKWEDEDKSREAFLKSAKLGEDPLVNSRDAQLPIGLKNLGATCYANAFLQVWYQDLPFRNGVFRCQPSQDAEHKFEESPIFQLQVTFAAMQESLQSAFNPVKLVESLKLRTTEQQDAQEFSKLFMAHLDTEFKKQSDPDLKYLISNQFQGKQVYGTICGKCHGRSERDSDFLELEVNLQPDAKLEDSIAALLEPETLSGDNKYLCSRCDSLENAKRYTELRELPPVLHFSLMRFVYDTRTMERKKCKHSIQFPTSIDMGQFIGSSETRKLDTEHNKVNNRYKLRGVLLHKGPSAYHGHYEAQVFDVKNQAWFQFNDETVTQIDSLDGSTRVEHEKVDKDKSKKRVAGQNQKLHDNARKKRRIDDSDVEIIEHPPSASNKSSNSTSPGPHYISSKQAYMLIYVRERHDDVPASAGDLSLANGHNAKINFTQVPPPSRALDVVKELNVKHEQACREHTAKKDEVLETFQRTRHRIMEVYRSWNVTSPQEDSVVVSRQALEFWLSRHIAKSLIHKTSSSTSLDGATDVSSKCKLMDDDHSISCSEIVCKHGHLDPSKAGEMKRITKVAYDKITEEDGCSFVPALLPTDVCEVCVQDQFTERLYQIEHPRIVAKFDEVSYVAEEDPGYWISKQWVKDWRLAKPKMHISSQADPAPDSPGFETHVRCEHGGLSANTTNRRRISAEAHHILQDLFPTWETFSSATELCPLCETMIHLSQEDKREFRRQAEEEKAKLKHMHDNALNGNTKFLENVPCAIIPAQFIRSWRQWLSRPAELPHPDRIDNSQLVCEHGLLSLDPNLPGDLDSSIAIIKRSEWLVLEQIYAAGPLVAIENTGDGFKHDLPVCEDCRLRRKATFDMTEVTIHVLGRNEAISSVDNLDSALTAPRQLHQTSIITYGSRKAGGLRQSNRIRQSKSQGKRRKITITKSMTVKDLKVMIQDELNIPTINQRLYHRGQELEDNTATVTSLGILANDLLVLREEGEDLNILDSDSDSDNPSKVKSEEGGGFGGTLLGGAPTVDGKNEMSNQVTHIACLACTFENDVDVIACTMCNTPFISSF